MPRGDDCRMMAEPKGQHGCPPCGRLRDEITSLKAKLQRSRQSWPRRKHSGNSSKPPSTDIVSPGATKSGKQGRGKKRKRGGQPGHPRHERTPFTPDEIDYFWEWRYPACPCCSGTLDDAPQQPAKTLQQVEIQDQPTIVEEHAAVAVVPSCRKVFSPPFPTTW